MGVGSSGTRRFGSCGEPSGMPTPAPLFQFLEYSASRVEAALARGETPHFEAALPTWYDAFFTLADRLELLAAIEALPDPRPKPYIPLSLLVLLTICRFLHCHKSFRRVGAVLLQDRTLLERFGVAPAICERGYYQNGERKPFDEERFSEVFRHLDPEPLHAVLVQAISALRRENPQWFKAGWFLMDSNHFRLKGSGQEYKWCALMLFTSRGLFPVAIEFSPVPGDGETTIGQRLVARVLSTYGEGFLRVLLMDAAYLDGEWLRELKEKHGIDWIIKSKEGMVVLEEMHRVAQGGGRWHLAPPPKLDLPKEQLPVRQICHVGELFGFVTDGHPVNGCLVRDTYPPSAKHPEGTVTDEGLLTSRMEWTGAEINEGWRRRWALENTFGQMTVYWGLGEWQIGLDEVYRALILIMALTYAVLQAYLTPERHHLSLQGVADQLAQQQREARLLVRVGGCCVIADPGLLNEWVAKGLLVIRGP
jgi:Transposase DDE domain